MNFVTLLLGLAAPLASRVFIALGLSVLTFVGLDAILSGMVSYFTTAFNGLPAKTLQIASLFGFPEAVGIILAGITTKLAMTQLTQWVRS